jgi:hypothetical protein
MSGKQKQDKQEVEKPEQKPNFEEAEIVENNSRKKAPVVLREEIVQIRQSPFPPPEEIKEYKAIDKTYPDRIFKMTEKEQKFRHTSTYVGQFSFLALVSVGYGAAIYTGINGAQFVGVAIAVGTSYLAYVFKSEKPKPPKQSQDNKPEE